MSTDREFDKKVSQSKFIFVGTVRKKGASNLKALPAKDDLLLVEITHVTLAPDAFRGVEGTVITVKIPPRTKIKGGDTKLFFTKRLMYGENLAVEAIAVDAVDKDYNEVSRNVMDAIERLDRREKLSHINKSELVLEGEVIKLEQSNLNKNYPYSFKSPFWVEVTIRIDKVLKGRFGEKKIVPLINKGGEVEEGNPLEVEVGQKGVWILKKEKLSHLKNELGTFYVLEEADDFFHSYEYQMLIS